MGATSVICSGSLPGGNAESIQAALLLYSADEAAKQGTEGMTTEEILNTTMLPVSAKDEGAARFCAEISNFYSEPQSRNVLGRINAALNKSPFFNFSSLQGQNFGAFREIAANLRGRKDKQDVSVNEYWKGVKLMLEATFMPPAAPVCQAGKTDLLSLLEVFAQPLLTIPALDDIQIAKALNIRGNSDPNCADPFASVIMAYHFFKKGQLPGTTPVNAKMYSQKAREQLDFAIKNMAQISDSQRAFLTAVIEVIGAAPKKPLGPKKPTGPTKPKPPKPPKPDDNPFGASVPGE
ncbi:MAG: hypothetical protein V2A66_10590 [Pseudomonadota bacterium]